MLTDEIRNLLGVKTKYPICLEIAGDLAMWTTVDSGSEKASGPIPSFSAAKGIFEAILLIKSAAVIPYRVQICSPIKYMPYTFNYRGEKRKSTLKKEGNSVQIKSTVLFNPCYRIWAHVVNRKEETITESSKKWQGINHAHSYQDQFNRRIAKARNYRTPCLGWSEFLATYVGPFREETVVQENINMTVPTLTLGCFDSLNDGEWSPSYLQNVKIEKGDAYYVS